MRSSGRSSRRATPVTLILEPENEHDPQRGRRLGRSRRGPGRLRAALGLAPGRDRRSRTDQAEVRASSSRSSAGCRPASARESGSHLADDGRALRRSRVRWRPDHRGSQDSVLRGPPRTREELRGPSWSITVEPIDRAAAAAALARAALKLRCRRWRHLARRDPVTRPSEVIDSDGSFAILASYRAIRLTTCSGSSTRASIDVEIADPSYNDGRRSTPTSSQRSTELGFEKGSVNFGRDFDPGEHDADASRELRASSASRRSSASPTSRSSSCGHAERGSTSRVSFGAARRLLLWNDTRSRHGKDRRLLRVRQEGADRLHQLWRQR